MIRANEAFVDERHRRVRVRSEQLGSGGEGVVLALRKRSKCAKIYTQTAARDFAELEAKLVAMIKAPPPSEFWFRTGPNIAWPQKVLYRSSGTQRELAGFVMPRAKRGVTLERYLNPNERHLFAAWMNWRRLHLLAARLADAVATVHQAGHCIGDLNPQNVLATPDAKVVLVDTDSFQITLDTGEIAFCRVGVDEYLAPELLGPFRTAGLGKVRRTPGADNYSLAVLIYRLLLQSPFPFTREQRDALAAGAKTAPPPAVPPSPKIPTTDVLTPELQALFTQTFGPGLLNPAKRPSARDWADTLRHSAGQLRRCWRVRSHRYSRHSPACPWCSFHRNHGIEYFPPDHAWQRSELPLHIHPGDWKTRFSEAKRELVYRRFVRARLHLGHRTLCPGERSFIYAEIGKHLAIAPALRDSIIAQGGKKQALPPPKTNVLKVRRKLPYAWAAAATLLLAVFGLGVTYGVSRFMQRGHGLIATATASLREADPVATAAIESAIEIDSLPRRHEAIAKALPGLLQAAQRPAPSAATLARVAYCYQRLGDTAEAAHWAKRAVSLASSKRDASARALAYYVQGQVAENEQRWNDAVSAYQASLEQRSQGQTVQRALRDAQVYLSPSAALLAALKPALAGTPLTAEQLRALTPPELRLLRNASYARHGIDTHDLAINDFFYQDTHQADFGIEVRPNKLETERALDATDWDNIRLVKQAEGASEKLSRVEPRQAMPEAEDQLREAAHICFAKFGPPAEELVLQVRLSMEGDVLETDAVASPISSCLVRLIKDYRFTKVGNASRLKLRFELDAAGHEVAHISRLRGAAQ